MREFGEILDGVQRRIARAAERAGRDPAAVEIVAVTKTHGPDCVAEAAAAGLRIVGENKVQEAAWKKPSSVSGLDWHLIGHLQGNKVRPALELFDFIHSVDSVKLIDRLEAVAEEIGASPRILLEVNVAEEKSKTGLAPAAFEDAVREITANCRRVTLEGLMTMAPYAPDPEAARPYFRKLRELRDATEQRFGLALPRLSMGMSGDFEVAVEEGATWVRLGTVLFGDRPKKGARSEYGGVGDSDTYAGFGGLDSYSGAGPTVRVLD